MRGFRFIFVDHIPIRRGFIPQVIADGRGNGLFDAPSIGIVGITCTDTRRGYARQLVGRVVGVIRDRGAVGDFVQVAAPVVVMCGRAKTVDQRTCASLPIIQFHIFGY